jgi:hypothetical protein
MVLRKNRKPANTSAWHEFCHTKIHPNDLFGENSFWRKKFLRILSGEKNWEKNVFFIVKYSFFSKWFSTLMMSKTEERKNTSPSSWWPELKSHYIVEITNCWKWPGQTANDQDKPQTANDQNMACHRYLSKTGSNLGYGCPGHDLHRAISHSTAIDNRLLRTGGQITPTLGILLTAS